MTEDARTKTSPKHQSLHAKTRIARAQHFHCWNEIRQDLPRAQLEICALFSCG